MKVIYEVTDHDMDNLSLKIHKYAEDLFYALLNINEMVESEKKGKTDLEKEKILDILTDELFASKIHDIR